LGDARERYGDPTLYVRVFAANRDFHRDPDLITQVRSLTAGLGLTAMHADWAAALA